MIAGSVCSSIVRTHTHTHTHTTHTHTHTYIYIYIYIYMYKQLDINDCWRWNQNGPCEVQIPTDNLWISFRAKTPEHLPTDRGK